MLDKQVYEERYKAYDDMLDSFAGYDDPKHPWHWTTEFFGIYLDEDAASEAMSRRLKEVMEKFGIDPKDAAQVCGMDPREFMRVVNHPMGYKREGETRPHTRDKVLKVCAALGVPPTYIRGDSSNRRLEQDSESCESILSASIVAQYYSELDVSGKKAVTTVIRSMHQAQRAANRIKQVGALVGGVSTNLSNSICSALIELPPGEYPSPEEFLASDAVSSSFNQLRALEVLSIIAPWLAGISDSLRPYDLEDTPNYLRRVIVHQDDEAKELQDDGEFKVLQDVSSESVLLDGISNDI